MDAVERFLGKIVINDNGCWIWQAALDKDGYGKFWWRHGQTGRAPRFAYLAFRGEIANGLVIDHRCRVHACVNPEHLELVTVRENTLRGNNIVAKNARKTHCKQGHPFAGKNLRTKATQRVCRTCMAEQAAKRWYANLDESRRKAREQKRKQAHRASSAG